MKIGFTGSREGMTPAQREAVARFLREHKPTEVHHGDCVGSDEQFHSIAGLNKGLKIVVHPPDKAAQSAYCAATETRKPKPYLARNHNIVDETNHLIATPSGPEERRSGTWATIRWAKKQGKPMTIIFPDGRVEQESA